MKQKTNESERTRKALLSILEDQKKTLEALRVSEERYREFFEKDIAADYISTPQGKLLACNPSFAKMMGYDSVEEVLKINTEAFYMPNKRREFLDRLEKNKVLINNEIELIRKDGKKITCLENVVGIFDNQGKLIQFMGYMVDITERKRAEETLIQSEHRFRSIFEQAGIGVAEIDSLSGRFLKVNQKYAEIVGYDVKEMLQMTFADITYPDDLQPDLDNMQRLLRGDISTFTMEKRYICKDGKVIWVSLTVSPLWFTEKAPTFRTHLAIVADITERKLAEESLRKNVERMEAILKLFQKKFETVEDLIGSAVGEAVKLSESELGFLGFIDENETTMDAHLWSEKAMQECTIENKPTQFSVKEGGIWAEAVRQKKTIVVNNYSIPNPLKKGIPDEHVTIRRFISIPIIRDGRVVLVCGLANRQDNYTDDCILQVQLFLESFWDVVSRKRAENALRESELKLRNIFEHSTNLFYSHDTNHIFNYLSPQVKDLLGYEVEEALVKWTNLASDNPINEIAFQNTVRAIETGQPQPPYEAELLHKNGKKVLVEVREAPVVENGKTVAIVGSLTDITERKRAEEAVIESEERFRSIFENSRDVIFTISPEGNFGIINKAFELHTGHKVDEWLGKPFYDLIHPDDLTLAVENFKKTLSDEKVDPFELRIKSKTGEYRIGEFLPSSLIIGGKVAAVLCMAKDITDRRRSELLLNALNKSALATAGLLTSEEIFTAVSNQLESAGFVCVFLMLDESKQNLFIKHLSIPQKLLQKLLGLLGLNIEDVSFPIDKVDIFKQMYTNKETMLIEDIEISVRQALPKPLKGFASQVVKLLGNPKFITAPIYIDDTFMGIFSVQSNDLTEKDMPAISAFTHQVAVCLRKAELFQHAQMEIAERKRAEEALKQSEQKYKRFFEEDVTGDFISTFTGRLLDCNPAFVKMFGFASKEEALNTNVIELYKNAQERQKLLSRLQRERKLEQYEMEMLRRDGQSIIIIANIIGKFDDNNRLVEITGYLIDDTKRRKLEQQLLQAHKLESLGTLASGIAHDFNNILGIIMGHSSILGLAKSDSSMMSKSIDAITRATQRGASLVKQLLTFARKTEPIVEPVCVNDIIAEIVKLTQGTFPKTIVVSTTLQEGLPLIVADRTQIHQVLLNLCVNARDAMPKGGTISISTKCVSDKTLSALYPNVEAKEYVEIQVSDTGIGMDEATRLRIFEPFFTTKSIGEGTGLGLALVHGVIESHRGFIDVESAVGKGTTFRVYLPVREQTPAFELSEQLLKETIEDSPGGKETILFIEDEEMLRELVKEILVSKGYTVLTAEDGEQGVNTFLKHQKEIAVVLSDIGLPKMGGEEVFRKIREINPQAKVILASGFIEPNTKLELYKNGVKEFITKPYLPAEVLKIVRGVLDAEN